MDNFLSCIEKQENVKKLFSSCKTPEEKYEKLIECGRSLAAFAEEWKRPEDLVAGCQSVVYLHSEFKEGNIFFYASAEALISAGLAALLIAAYSGEPPEAILKCPPRFIEELGLQASLSPGRSNGLFSMHLRMKQDAIKILVGK